jgi:hypothetical protein
VAVLYGVKLSMTKTHSVELAADRYHQQRGGYRHSGRSVVHHHDIAETAISGFIITYESPSIRLKDI